MYALYNCIGVMVGKYKTVKGLNIAIGKMKYKLQYLADTTPQTCKVQENILWYTKLLEIKG